MKSIALHGSTVLLAVLMSGLLSFFTLASPAGATVGIRKTVWPQIGHDASHTGYNPDETAVSVKNAVGLKTVWSFNTADSVEGSPAVVDGWVYAGSDDGAIVGVNVASRKSWRFATNSSVIASPAVANGTVYDGTLGGQVFAVDALTGKKRWTFQTTDSIWDSPTYSGGIVYIGSADRKVYALNGKTGALEWSFTTRNEVDVAVAVAGGPSTPLMRTHCMRSTRKPARRNGRITSPTDSLAPLPSLRPEARSTSAPTLGPVTASSCP